MGATSLTTSENANEAGESRAFRYEGDLRANSTVMQSIRRFCIANKRKPISEIRAAVGVKRASDRMIQYWLSSKYVISPEDLACMLRSDAGFAILEDLMGDAKPVWWRDFKRGTKRSELRRKQAQLAKEIEEVEQSELDL